MNNNIETILENLHDLVLKLNQTITQSQSVAIFFDHSNFWHSVRRIRMQLNCKYTIDYAKLIQLLLRERFLVNVFFYYSDYDEEYYSTADESVKEGAKKRDNLHKYLASLGFTLIKTKLVKHPCGTIKEKGLDVTLAQDITNFARETPRCSTVILVSGDGDYTATVIELKKKYGVRVEVAFFNQETSASLKQHAFKFIDLEPIKHDFQLLQTK
jgi:uncharacterized LabA/DUF88 family protein